MTPLGANWACAREPKAKRRQMKPPHALTPQIGRPFIRHPSSTPNDARTLTRLGERRVKGPSSACAFAHCPGRRRDSVVTESTTSEGRSMEAKSIDATEFRDKQR